VEGSRREFLCGVAGLAASATLARAALAQSGAAPLAIVGADVLPMTGRERLTDQTVIVSGDRIIAVGLRSRLRVPAGARTIPARGMTLMPGLVDMHVHLAPVPGQPGDAAQRAMAVMLAHGVTTARSMAGSPNNLLARSAVEAGQLAGPRLYVAAPALHVNSASSAAAARAAVQQARTAGYDLIKSHHITDPTIWQAVQSEARAQGLPTAGHVTNEIGIERAAAAGQQIEHLDGVFLALMPAEAAERSVEFAQIPPPPVIEAAVRGAPRTLPALARRLAGARSWHVPTLALFEKIVDTGNDTGALRARPEMRFVPEGALTQWANQRAQFAAQSGYTPQMAERFRTLRRQVVLALHRAGVPIMAGSDTAQFFHLWGPGLIEEVDALAAAGLTPMEALRSATVVPRDYFRSLPRGGSAQGRPADFGTVEAGARADLLLLRGDPSRSLSALRQVQAVVAAGVLHDRVTLDAMLERVAADARAA
jgi:imidazolonepropionase-like amidohydrolase